MVKPCFMKFISHRGNINGVNFEFENNPKYIDSAIDKGYDVEIDIRLNENKLFLGHDEPQYQVSVEWLLERKENLWIHSKDFLSLTLLIGLHNNPLKVFFHQNEDYTIISDLHIWSHNLSKIDNRCIIPLLSKHEIENWVPTNVYGVCSDYIQILKENLHNENNRSY